MDTKPGRWRFDEEQHISFRVFPQKIRINYKGENGDFTVKRTDRYCLDQVIKFSIINSGVG